MVVVSLLVMYTDKVWKRFCDKSSPPPPPPKKEKKVPLLLPILATLS